MLPKINHQASKSNPVAAMTRFRYGEHSMRAFAERCTKQEIDRPAP
jgi:hypothetical protein